MAVGFNFIAFIEDVAAFFFIYGILSLSLNVEYGFGGLPNLGKALFFAAGAFTVGAATSRLTAVFLGEMIASHCEPRIISHYTAVAMGNPPLAITLFLIIAVIAVGIGGLLGYLTTYPAIRLREDYLAITLIAASELVRVIGRVYEPIICGAHGTAVPDLFVWLNGYGLRESGYLIIMGVSLFLVYLLVERISESPLGRVLRAIRENELAASALGKDVPYYKMLALVMGSMIAAYAGVLYSFYTMYISDAAFQPVVTFIVLMMVVMGGAGNNLGVLVGSFVYIISERLILQFKDLLPLTTSSSYVAYIVFGILLMYILMKKPEGLLPERPAKTPMILAKKLMGKAARPQ